MSPLLSFTIMSWQQTSLDDLLENGTTVLYATNSVLHPSPSNFSLYSPR